MGSDLIGFLVVGPKELNVSKKEKAIKKVEYIIKRCSNIDPTAPTERDKKLLEEMGIFSDYQESIEEAISLVLEIDNPVTFVEDFMEFWGSPETRDVAWRYYGKKQIVFAGDSTWGDEPNGQGYELLKLAYITGIAKVFKVE
jgi:hypothetical protein